MIGNSPLNTLLPDTLHLVRTATISYVRNFRTKFLVAQLMETNIESIPMVYETGYGE